MEVFDRIDKIIEHFKGIEVTNGCRIIHVQYPQKWGVFPSEDEKIKVAKSDESLNEYFYYGKIDDVTFGQMFDLIEETIQMNKSAEEKFELLNVKFEELKNIFATESLEKLKKLEFTFKNIKQNKKTSKKIKNITTTPLNVDVNDNVNSISHEKSKQINDEIKMNKEEDTCLVE